LAFWRRASPERELVNELKTIRVEWSDFADRLLHTFSLLNLQIPCREFQVRPSPESAVATIDALLAVDRRVAIEFRDGLTVCIMLEALICDAISEALKQGRYRAEIYLRYALPRAAIEVFDTVKAVESQTDKAQWVNAFMSTWAGWRAVGDVQEASIAIATAVHRSAYADNWSPPN
jgi:hypothetical protein